MHGVYFGDLLHNLLHLGAPDSAAFPVSLVEKMVRPVIVYLFVVFALRLWGKRMLAQLNPFDFVVLLTLSNTVQNAIIGNDTSLSGGLVGAATLLGINALLVRIFYRGPTRALLGEGSGDICLISKGVRNEQAMARLHINVGELTAKAHERGFDSLAEVETATLYPNGTLYFESRGGMSDQSRHTEILRRLDLLQQDLSTLAQRTAG
jgi:uncharacterized membrane protein YcaP (DUF421 family)